MTITNISADDDTQSFETPQKKHSVNALSAQGFLGSKALQYQDNNTTHRPG